MGQALTEKQKATLRNHKDVLHVSATHVVLTDGSILDPNDFAVEVFPVMLVCKLLRCSCRSAHHTAGKHVVVETIGGKNVFTA